MSDAKVVKQCSRICHTEANANKTEFVVLKFFRYKYLNSKRNI